MMNHFSVKVCGITRAEDGCFAAELGVDMVGMIFYRRSPRFVTIKRAASIVASLPPTVDRVGLFIDEKVEKITRVASRLRLDYIQLHGSEPARDIAALRKSGFKVIKAFHIVRRSDYGRILGSKADLVLVDNATSRQRGGTGRAFDWSLTPPKCIPNLVLAGGLSVDNLEEGIRRFRPLVVDVNSGVESSPGLKSRRKLKQFLNLCNELRYGKKE